MIDLKCGTCGTFFYIQKETYRERMLSQDKIHCPSCFDSAPFDVEYVVKTLVAMSDLRSWEVGTRLEEKNEQQINPLKQS